MRDGERAVSAERREREVLAELARARTIASIAEELVVSENTIKLIRNRSTGSSASIRAKSFCIASRNLRGKAKYLEVMSCKAGRLPLR